MPIEVLGMQGTPQAGDRFAVVTNEAQAREISQYRQRLAREKAVARQAVQRGSLEQMMSQLQTTGVKEFPLVIKGDVQGSIEAISAALENLGNEEVMARIVHAGAGGITESDVALAEAPTPPSASMSANKQARSRGTGGHRDPHYNIIYDLIDDEIGHVRHASPSARPSSAMPRSSKCSTSPRSARKGLPCHGRQGRARCRGAPDPRQCRHP